MDFVNKINKAYRYTHTFIFVVLPLTLFLFCAGMMFNILYIFVAEVNESGGKTTSISINKIPESVLKHKDTIIKYMNEYNIPMVYLPYILAQATQESFGKEPDIFQASESKYNGQMGMIKTPEESIEHAMKRWREIMDEIEKRKLKFSVELVLQTYNFGSGFLDYVEKNGKEYTEEVAKNFSNFMLRTLPNWNYSVYGDIYYIKHIFRYLVFEYDEDFDASGIVLKSGDKETLENFVSDFGTPDIRSLESGITGVTNYSYNC